MTKKIRVLHCVTAMNRGGLESFIMNNYRHIDLDKFEFDFLVQRKGPFDYSKEINELGGHVYSVPAFNPFKIREYNRALEDFFAKNKGKYDIIHAHNNSFAMYVLRAAKKYDYPVRISHSHIANTKFNLIRMPFVTYNKLKLKKVCNVRFACGKAAGRWLFGDDNFTIIKNAVDLKKFKFNEKRRDELREKYNIDDDTILIGHIGRFEAQKNHKYLVKILKQLKIVNVNAKLMLIGKGSLMDHIVKLAKKDGLINDVIFVGGVENPQDYLCAMDVFAMPSYHEGFPVTLIEAQANDLPCVISNTISSECKILPIVNYLPVNNAGLDKWCESIIRFAKHKRGNPYDILVNAGYEISNAAKTLESIYEVLNRQATQGKDLRIVNG